jgi:hypothetical protein
MQRRILLRLCALIALFALPIIYRGVLPTGSSKAEVRWMHALNEPRSPVSITSSTATQNFYFEHVKVRNTSGSTVSSITFGVAMYPVGVAQVHPVTLDGPSIPTDLAPGGEQGLDIYMARIPEVKSRAAQLKWEGAYIELGVLSVEFQDGSVWRFTPNAGGGFTDQHERDAVGSPRLSSG